jgi:hypothetical protein
MFRCTLSLLNALIAAAFRCIKATTAAVENYIQRNGKNPALAAARKPRITATKSIAFSVRSATTAVRRCGMRFT